MELSKGTVSSLRLMGWGGLNVALLCAVKALVAEDKHALIPLPILDILLTIRQTIVAAGLILIVSIACLFLAAVYEDPAGD
jgi:hypothetical protein